MHEKEKSEERKVIQSLDLIFESGDEFTNRDTYRRIMTNMKGKINYSQISFFYIPIFSPSI